MSLLKRLKMLKKTEKKSKEALKIISHATLNISEATIELECNGTPSVIIMECKGNPIVDNYIPLGIKVKVSTNKILINNPFALQLPKTIFGYEGNIDIYNCRIHSFDGSIQAADINNIEKTKFVENSETKPEDDSIIMQDDPISYKAQIGYREKGGLRAVRVNTTAGETREGSIPNRNKIYSKEIKGEPTLLKSKAYTTARDSDISYAVTEIVAKKGLIKPKVTKRGGGY